MPECGLAEPVLETNFAESRVVSRNQRALVEFCPEVPRARVDDNLTRVVARGEAPTDQLIEAEPFRAGHFNRAIQWRAHGGCRNRLGNVIGRHGLNQCRWQPNRLAEALECAHVQAAVIQEQVAKAKDRGDIDSAVSLAATSKRLLAVIDETEKLKA